jgi:hypothetical protein
MATRAGLGRLGLALFRGGRAMRIFSRSVLVASLFGMLWAISSGASQSAEPVTGGVVIQPAVYTRNFGAAQTTTAEYDATRAAQISNVHFHHGYGGYYGGHHGYYGGGYRGYYGGGYRGTYYGGYGGYGGYRGYYGAYYRPYAAYYQPYAYYRPAYYGGYYGSPYAYRPNFYGGYYGGYGPYAYGAYYNRGYYNPGYYGWYW